LFVELETAVGNWKMRVKVHYVGLVRSATNTGQDEIELEDGASMSKLLDKLAGKYGTPFEKDIYEPGMQELKLNFVATVNGLFMDQLNGVGTQLKNGDNITLMSLMTGG
jgi:molybdopterin converting factor small subunit